jgi:hypothetical protein
MVITYIDAEGGSHWLTRSRDQDSLTGHLGRSGQITTLGLEPREQRNVSDITHITYMVSWEAADDTLGVTRLSLLMMQANP